MNLIAFAVSLVLTETALTLAFAGVVLSASWLDRRYDLKLLSYFVQAGVIVCGYRLVVDPGLPWALGAPLHEVLIAFGGVIALLFAALGFAKARGRVAAIVTLESAVWSLPGTLVCLLIYRALAASGQTDSHWALSIFGMVWLISGSVQYYRARVEGVFRTPRLFLASVFCATGSVLLLAALTLGNPLSTGQVIGLPILDSLLVAYGLPALLIAGLIWLLSPRPKPLQAASAAQMDQMLSALIQTELQSINIPIGPKGAKIRYDSEEACERDNKGNWQQRYRYSQVH